MFRLLIHVGLQHFYIVSSAVVLPGEADVEGTPFGRYRLVELLGRGGMGEVWRALDTATNNRTVAIKLLPPHLAQDDTFVQRFRREADAAARLSNPHIIPIHNYGEIDGRLYVDMRLVEGRDLQEVLADGPLPPARTVEIVGQVAKALQAAHQVGLVHRDVKPSNILLDRDDFAYLIDFGIADDVTATKLTNTGVLVGTLAYMAPERFTTGRADVGADVYSLACVLHECLTGVQPYPGDSAEQQISGHLTLDPPKPSRLNPSIPAAFDEVIARGMAKQPTARFSSASELARAATAVAAMPQSPTRFASAPSQPSGHPSVSAAMAEPSRTRIHAVLRTDSGRRTRPRAEARAWTPDSRPRGGSGIWCCRTDRRFSDLPQ